MEKRHNKMQELTKEDRLKLFIERYPEQYTKSLGVYKLKPEKIKDIYERAIRLKEYRKQYIRQYRIKNKDKLEEKRKYLQSLKPKKIKKIRDELYYVEKRKKNNERDRLKRLNNPEKYRILSRNKYWRNREKHKLKINRYLHDNKESVKKQQKNYRFTFPEKTKARYLYSVEIKKGNVKNLPCENCGTLKTHAHHDDYNFPLKVRYLCSKHHHEFHREHTYDTETFTYLKKII